MATSTPGSMAPSTCPAVGAGSRCPVPVPPGPSLQGRTYPAATPGTPPQRRAGRDPLLPGDVPHRQAVPGPGSAPPDLHSSAAARAVLLLLGPRLRPDPPTPADLV